MKRRESKMIIYPPVWRREISGTASCLHIHHGLCHHDAIDDAFDEDANEDGDDNYVLRDNDNDDAFPDNGYNVA